MRKKRRRDRCSWNNNASEEQHRSHRPKLRRKFLACQHHDPQIFTLLLIPRNPYTPALRPSGTTEPSPLSSERLIYPKIDAALGAAPAAPAQPPPAPSPPATTREDLLLQQHERKPTCFPIIFLLVLSLTEHLLPPS